MRRRHLAGPIALSALVLLVAALSPVTPWSRSAQAERVLARAAAEAAAAETGAPPTTATPPTTAATAVQHPAAAPTTTIAPTTTAAPTTTTAVAPDAPRFTFEPYRGLGAWLDIYDWSATYAQDSPAVEPTVLDLLAAHGTQTLYIQASRWDAPEDVLEAPRLLAFIERAHQNGISVVAWYLPTYEDPGRDLRRMLAIAALPVDGLAIDIESRKVGDVVERNRRVVEVSNALRAALPGEVLGAIPLEPVLIEDVNPRYWPGFPWAELAPSYDVWLPMAYWTNRRGGWRNAHDYTAANIDRVRAHIGQPDAPVHALGGIGDTTSVEDLHAFYLAASQRGVLGGSIYDYRTTLAPHWEALTPFRALRDQPGRGVNNRP